MCRNSKTITTAKKKKKKAMRLPAQCGDVHKALKTLSLPSPYLPLSPEALG